MNKKSNPKGKGVYVRLDEIELDRIEEGSRELYGKVNKARLLREGGLNKAKNAINKKNRD